MNNRFCHIIFADRRRKSPTFVKRTSFASAAAFQPPSRPPSHGSWCDWNNYCTVWELDHKIPREAYDFDNPEDIKRCWSAKNVHAMTNAGIMKSRGSLRTDTLPRRE